MDPSKVDFDEYTDSYNELLRSQTRFFSPDEAYFARYKARIAGDLLPVPPESVLEFGCGIGRNISFLRAEFPQAAVSGSDISAKSIEIARRENPGVRFWVEGAEGTPNGDERYDLIFVAGVFHHVPRPARAALSANLLARLRPGGNLLVFEHNPFNPITRRIVDRCPYDADAVLLTPGELRRHLQGAGLAVRRTGYALFLPPRLKALARAERLLTWLPLGGQYWIWAQTPV